ncbi:MAG: LptF/LptG family permease [Planctomycetes bacterium]|nr:LptF/LptG family permease [Planctomycetota bacterium]
MSRKVLNSRLLSFYWGNFFQIFGLAALMLAFGVVVQTVLKQENFPSPFLLLLILMDAIPDCIPYVACLSAIYWMRRLHDRGELQLLQTLGCNTVRLALSVLIAPLCLCLILFIHGGFLSPLAHLFARCPTAFLSAEQIASKLGGGHSTTIGSWQIFAGESHGAEFISPLLRSNSPSQNIFIIADSGAIVGEQDMTLSLKQGRLFIESGMPGGLGISFQCLDKPFSSQPESIAHRERPLPQLLKEIDNPVALKALLLILRDSLSPLFLFFLGIALGRGLASLPGFYSNSVALLLLALVYFPLCILGKRADYNQLPLLLVLIALPHMVCISVSAALMLRRSSLP